MNSKGFTLVELVVVVLLLSVLAVTVFPKLNSTSDFTYIAQRDQIISLLRNVQQRAMQNTQSNTCHVIRFDTSTVGLSSQNADGSCATGLITTVGNNNDYLLVEVEESYTASNSVGNSITNLEFNDLGQPSPSAGSCNDQCVISVSADYKVCIESEGYIHVCQ